VYGRAVQISCRGGSGHPESEQTNRPQQKLLHKYSIPSLGLRCRALLNDISTSNLQYLLPKTCALGVPGFLAEW
jgi:hypothetical protein